MSAEVLLEIERDLNRLADWESTDGYLERHLRDLAYKAGAEAERIKLAKVRGDAQKTPQYQPKTRG